MGLPSPSGEYSGPPPGTAEAIITVISSDCNPCRFVKHIGR
ncbi:hypothetical protein HMPREF0372_02539 [Flavonifractor plautii ATCC 29863]|uniref:Uncharacterized protein n=1 Tax=Flavonifractor plautii ATCC 29863 TaxID=411475 RepID=G9YSN1_FLAPL|nr:hypothetical protein HMPREF0372_02539 [Flavonifractor plautii ATCC 29863]